ncbi:hypothetical protein GCM10023195_84040 [Actinoallomurus liliacearum]|uniref:Major facilitator superfamily (MFS) profile domain-containing protein n=2 Tax=Actinoallomurus liliacearum TaxID=1080073 RepID=A0ABP8TX49_9ACTN
MKRLGAVIPASARRALPGHDLPSLPVILIGLVITGLGLATMVVGFTTVIQRRTPGPLIGRVSAAAETLVSGPQTISVAAGAALVSVVDYRLLLMVVTAGMLAAAACLWPARRLTAPTSPTDRLVEMDRP